ncbi:MAG: hypothetical protein COW01_08325 [Bdellovibrionales bacterium CG12_big_fil_rev_8_21_14_0_65_38_15]|nr:MAG: hypothetical protein COW79_16205 [Bdellovibrionales bacterium CG22_combo_CG10-13_8_21_14_all_38_13]PIQ55199.1 MAG: hypothetical protein COW01_08325 [Bdellovibrionales bacterium CG12_big_fil_rev_8_21_14_0_65_38_15]PIR28744.1 MAG: hypothetical protein COV38_14170 [Bdellovibrionales bacterium CG11_big_fil_rev_8_21_14_0_20_38_13]
MQAGLCPLEDWDQALDFLKALGISRSHLKKHLSSAQLKKSLRAKAELDFSLDVLNPGLISPEYSSQQPKIIDENDDFIIIHKPENVHGHALNYLEQDNILCWLRSIGYGKYLNVALAQHERGLLYRLDQATSGVLLYVKREDLWNDLRARFHQVAHLKRYIVVLDEKPVKEGLLNAWFDLTGKKVKASEIHKAQWVEGSMFVRTIREDARGVVVAVDLAHGHRHQIRSHFAMFGTPIRGDKFYNGKEAERLFLHAYQYKIENLINAKDVNLGFGSDFLDLDSDLEMLGDHSGIIHGR